MKRLIAVVALIALVASVPMPAMAGKWAKGLYAKSITDVYKVYYNRYTKGGKKGKPVLFQFGVGDFSGDNLPEIVLGGPILDMKTSGQLYTRMKTFVISPSKKGKFSLYKPMHNVMPYSDNARHAIIADFNGDNRNDLFIVDHGIDADPFPGDQNVLVLSRGKRKFFNAKTRVPKLKDFSHGVAAGDVDGDGDIDLFIAQSRHEGSSHHYFLENRKGKFIRVPNGKWIDESLSKIATGTSAPGGGIDRLSTAGLEDIDGDGQIDLVLVIGKGESLHNTRIVFGQKGKFKASNVVELPADGFFKNKKKGIYLDVGSQHPIANNNTYLLYKKGWSGINIDLDLKSIQLFNLARSRDININAAVSSGKFTKDLFFYHDKSAINTIEKKIAAYQTAKVKEVRTVVTKTLNDILKDYLVNKVDYLNIDVEGHEIDVLNGFDINKFSPEIISIEFLDLKMKKLEFKNNNLNNVLNSSIYKYMTKNGYGLINWNHADLIFINNKLRD